MRFLLTYIHCMIYREPDLFNNNFLHEPFSIIIALMMIIKQKPTVLFTVYK